MAPLVGGPKRLYDVMRDDASRGGGVSTCSDSTHARRLGVCRRTIIRWKCQLASEGKIERAGYHQWSPRKRTVRWLVPNVTQDVKTQTTGARTEGSHVYLRMCSGGPRHTGRRRRLMEKHPEKIAATGVTRADGSVTPFNAGDAIAAIVDMYGLPMLPAWKARIGKDAKDLLDAGFPPNIVVLAGLTAVQMARPGMVQNFAVEFLNEVEGMGMDWTAYRRRLHGVGRASDPARQRIFNALEEAFKK